MRWRGQLKANSRTGFKLSRQVSAKLIELEKQPPTKVTALAEMTPEKQAEMRRLYAKPPHPDDGELDYYDVFGQDGHK